MKTKIAGAAPRKFKPPQTPAQFRRRVQALFKRAGLRDADPVVREVFSELIEILCQAYQSGGLPEVRRVWAITKRVVFKRGGTLG